MRPRSPRSVASVRRRRYISAGMAAFVLASVSLQKIAEADSPADMAAVVNADGGVEVVIANSNEILHSWDGATNWISYKPGGHDVVAATDKVGRMMIAWLNNGKLFFMGAPYPRSSLGPPQALLLQDFQHLAVSAGTDGQPILFALDGNGRLWSLAAPATSAGPGLWQWASIPSALDGTELRSVVVTPFNDGRWVAVALGGNHTVYFRYPRNLGLQPWAPLAGSDLQAIYAIQNANHALEVVAKGQNGILYFRHQSVPFTDNVPWNESEAGPEFDAWQPMSAQIVDSSVLFALPIGTLAVRSWQPGATDTITHTQVAPNGSWGGPTKGDWSAATPHNGGAVYIHGYVVAYGRPLNFASMTHEVWVERTAHHNSGTAATCYDSNGQYTAPGGSGGVPPTVCVPATPPSTTYTTETHTDPTVVSVTSHGSNLMLPPLSSVAQGYEWHSR